MRLFNDLIAILAIKILFVEVNIWHVNAIMFVDFDPKFHFERSLTEISDSKCNESHKIIQLIPYLETYRSSSDDMRDIHTISHWHFFQIKSRVNYKMVWKCCKGYFQSGATCVPRCPPSCEKGTCKEPDICTCNNGYRMLNDSEGSCVPECTNGCVNGTCIDPEVCSCNQGYWIDADGFTCRPVCNAECERNYGYCSEPNVCTCRTGYKKIGNDSSPFTCEPICDRPCTNGRCAAPNVCMCADGYEADEYDPFTCKPKCHQPCVFGTCTAPRTCTCDYGYRMTNMSVCEPICSEPCVMGTCIAPESCSCNEGYGHRNGISRYICEPICEIDCGNGTCTAPGLCTCNKGFVYDEIDRVCKPHCPKQCRENEECTSPDKCTCLKGYYSSSRTIYLRASFLNNYERPITVNSLCQPTCNFICINGQCTAPNECTCDLDHYPSWIEFHHSLDNKMIRICTKLPGPPCDAFSCGDNKTCHISGICICNDGYAKDTNGDCVPFCAQGCSNGTCTAPNSCACHDGFAPRNESFCEPICERGCQNGDCIGPNRCVCHDNFVPSIYMEPECIPMCTRNCSGHGECIIDLDNDYRCECHFGWTGWNCDQPNMCVITMAYDHNNVNRVTIHNDTNSTIMRAHESAPYCKCDKSFDNETLCYTVQPDEGNKTFIGCLLNTELPCYTTPRYNASVNVTKIVWPFVIIVILVITGLTAAAYLMYRNRQKKKLTIAGPSTNIFVRESFATEFLLPDNEI